MRANPACEPAIKPNPTLWQRLRTEDAGSELVEFALTAGLLFTLIFGILGACQLLYSYHYAAFTAREATRYAMVRGSSWKGTTCASTTSLNCTASSTNISNFITSITPLGFQASNLAVATTWPGTTPTGAGCASTNGANSPGCIVVVKVTYTYSFIIPFVPAATLPLVSTSSVAISR